MTNQPGLDDIPWSMGVSYYSYVYDYNTTPTCNVQVVTITMIEQVLERKWHN